jgi:quercetin dioxygenase-like cupin family protein
MKMPPMPMSITDWSEVEAATHPGETGVARWKTKLFGDIRVRMVEYSPGYFADHWCSKGHVLLCLEGSLDLEIRDGERQVLSAGQSYHVGDGDPPHRSGTLKGAKLFIVD